MNYVKSTSTLPDTPDAPHPNPLELPEDLRTCGACGQPIKRREAAVTLTATDRIIPYDHRVKMLLRDPKVIVHHCAERCEPRENVIVCTSRFQEFNRMLRTFQVAL